MQSNVTDANSNSSRERLDSSAATISQKYRARKESSKPRAADCVECNDCAKHDGAVLVEASNASRSTKVIVVNLRVCYEDTMRCTKPPVINLVSRSSTYTKSFKRGVTSV